jgi:phosphoglycolate phosphatase-like HAD superfamily hydrolase
MAAFDMDGTIVDSMGQLRELGVQVLGEFYKMPFAEAATAYDSTVGLPFHEQLNRLFPLRREYNQRAALHYRQIHWILAKDFKLGHRFAETLMTLRKQNIHCVLVSSTVAPLITQAMPQVMALPWSSVFGYKGKDKADQIIQACYTHGVRPSEVVYFGDTPADGAYAKRVGCRIVYSYYYNITRRVSETFELERHAATQA